MDLSSFKNWLLLNCNAKASAKTHLNNLTDFFRHYNEFTLANVNDFFLTRQEKWTSPSTFNLYLNSFRWYLKFSNTQFDLPKYKIVDVKVQHYLKENELEDIICKLPMIFRDYKRAGLILLLMFECGLRPKEIINLKKENVDLENKHFLLKDTKTNVERITPLSERTAKLLQEYFLNESGKENVFNLTKFGLGYIFHQINIMLNLKNKISPYTMRRSYMHYMIKKGLKLTSLQSNAGHKSVNTTLRYLCVSQEEAVEEAREILNKRRKR